MGKQWTGAEIRRSFIEYFEGVGHTFVPSSSLVPGGDQTLLFTNAGMVQFKDVFLGTDDRPYRRAVNSQKCMRVAGKHNDLDDVGRDDTHHTFFEMLGNWSFGDYYKKEAIAWAWELLTKVWGLEKSRLWATVFRDDQGDIPEDAEAATEWLEQPGFQPDHLLYYGRKDNFWEMADTGPCGPCSEIHYDRGEDYCEKKDVTGHTCRVNGDCRRFLEIWNLVFIQYNRLNAKDLQPLPARHVDTGMGFERIVSILQNVDSNYRTDLLMPLLEKTRILAGHSLQQMEENFTPYRVIADHARAAAFLIADGVVPGNTGRNYVCRMIIRRAARFGSKIGLVEPFLAKIAYVVIENYGAAYPELRRNQVAILDSITREEKRFQRTVETGVSHLEDMFSEMIGKNIRVLDGKRAFDLYATHGLPLEITRDIAREQGYDVDETGFRVAMEEHRLSSGAGKAFGALGGEDAEFFRDLLDELINSESLPASGVRHDPYSDTTLRSKISAMLKNGFVVPEVQEGDYVDIILSDTSFYIESGGQVSDTGKVNALDGSWEISIEDVRKPIAGIVLHSGKVLRGVPKTGDVCLAAVDVGRRNDIMRNHTATHLLHAWLRKVVGESVRQAGSLVAPDRLRFDFTHSEPVTPKQLAEIEYGVNQSILANQKLNIRHKPLQEAVSEGAMALFGEKYGEVVRTIAIGDETPLSYELCGGTHVDETGDIGVFIITSEGSAAAGIRRIEAVTGRMAYELVRHKFGLLKQTAGILECSQEELPQKATQIIQNLTNFEKQLIRMRQDLVRQEFDRLLENTTQIGDAHYLVGELPEAEADTLRQMADIFKQEYPVGVIVLGSVIGGQPILIAAVTDALVQRFVHAGELVKHAAQAIGGSGGGRPQLAQAGGKNPTGIKQALESARDVIRQKLQST